MAACEIEYAELYTNDMRSALSYFRSSLGFAQIAKSADSGRTSVLLRQGSVQIVVTAGADTWKFVDEHGHGIANIAFACDDVPATWAAALKAGAVPADPVAGGPVLFGFGGIRHTLLPSVSHPGGRLPAGRTWDKTATEADWRAGRIRLLDHVAVCLEGGTLEGYADFYEAAFGLARHSSAYVEVGGQAMNSIVVRSQSGGITLTLLEPDLAKIPGQLDAFLDRNGGPGVQHLAFLVDDIIPAVSDFRGRGVEFLHTPGTYYDVLACRFPEMRGEVAQLRATGVLADRDEFGYLLQLFTRSPFDQNTLFCELIQRRGARGFGNANIQALYEAVERDRRAVG